MNAIKLVRQNMEFHSDWCKESNDQKPSKVNTSSFPPQAKQRKKLGSILNFEKCERPCDDFHPQVLNNAEKSKGFHQKQQVERQFRKSEEVVRYMSCLPGYLERGENPQEKSFNIGVLDWRLLEKWQHNNNDIVGINSEHSPSTSSTTSFISSKGSSSHCSSNNNTRSGHRQRIKYPSTPTEGCSSGTKLPAGNTGEFVDCKSGSVNLLKVQEISSQATQSSSLHTVNRIIDSESKDRDLEKITGTRSQPFETDGVVSGLKRNGKIHKGEASKAKEQVPSSAVTDHDFSERCQTAVPESRNDPGSRHVAVRRQPESSKGSDNRSLEESCYAFYGGSSAKVCHTRLRSDHTHLYSVTSEHGKTRDSQVEKCFTKEMRSLNCPSGKEQKTQFTESVSISPSRRNLEKENAVSKTKNLGDNEISQMKMSISESTKVRNPSPTRRFSFGMGRIGKNSKSNSSAVADLVSENVPDSKVTSTSACSNHSTTDKSNATSRARSSPLRRLLDPILKPKGVDSHDFTRPSEKNPSTTGRALKPSSRQMESPALHSVKGTLGLNGSKTSGVGGPQHTQKNGTSSTQALLQVAVKNGLPLFTFTVDNCSDILAATVKELSPNKMTCGWIYTFFSFSEMKKKNGYWINQGSKDRNPGYISNIVAQMKVSDILRANSTGETYVCNSSRREFVLTSVGSGDVDQTSDSRPDDELAAIIVKFPEKISGHLNQDSQEPFPQVRNCSNSGNDKGNESANDDSFSTTVILPGGHHGAPSKGEPSPLIERWKSGGSCDCGGWDLGCQMRILANQRFKSSKSQLNAFKLFSQEEVEDERPMFVLSPFEDGIFSVEFNSSLKLVQAFSIGIAVLHCRTSAVLSSNMFGGKMSEEISASGNSVSKIFNQAQVEVSTKFATNPPLSPVGRV